MKLQCIVAVCFCLIATRVARAGQQGAGTADRSSQTSRTATIERTYPSGGPTSSRQTETRLEVGGREVITETIEAAGTSGRLEPVGEITTEVVRTGPNRSRSSQSLFGIEDGRRRVLLEKTVSDQEISPDGRNRVIETTWTADPNGRLGVRLQRVEETRSNARNGHESTATTYLPDINDTLRESERTESIERAMGARVVRDSTHLTRDLNDRWQAIETRTQDSRQQGSSVLEEETVVGRDMNGQLRVNERTTTRRSRANGRDDAISETYTPDANQTGRPDAHFALSRRVRTSTSATADGGSRTVEEVEERNQVAPADPLRLTRRSEVTVRRIGSDRWLTERHVFELDVNGRMVPVISEVQETRTP